MKFPLPLLAALAGTGLAVLPAAAQQSLYSDSPARANPKAIPPKRDPSFDNAVRGPRGPLDWERTVALSPDGRLFVTRNADGHLRVWELGSGRSEVELPAGVLTAVFSPDSRLLACRFEKPSGQPGGRFWQVFTAADGKPAGGTLAAPEADADGAELVAFSPDGRLLAGFLGEGANVRVALWDTAGGPPKATQPVTQLFGGVTLAFSPDGKTLAAAGAGSATALLNLPDLKPLRTLASAGPRLLVATAFSPDGKLLAAGGDERRIVRGVDNTFPVAALYEAATGRLVAELKLPATRPGRVRQVLFANDGRALVTVADRGLQAWASADGRLQAILPDGGFPAAVSPDGRTLAAALLSDLACWDTTTWRLGLHIPNARPGLGTVNGPQGNTPLVFAPDGGIVAMRGDSVAAWELSAGRLIAERAATQARVVY